MKNIQLTKGKITIIDDCDYDLDKFKWRLGGSQKNYAVREVWNYGERYTEHLHRIILERKIGRKLLKKEVTDHIDGNGLNNTRSNLRVCSQSENMTNIRRRKDNKTGFTGIYFNKDREKFEVYINKNKKRYRLGRYKKLEEAIKVRKESEKKYWKI